MAGHANAILCDTVRRLLGREGVRLPVFPILLEPFGPFLGPLDEALVLVFDLARELRCATRSINARYAQLRDGRKARKENPSLADPRHYGLVTPCFCSGCDEPQSHGSRFCDLHRFRPPQGHDLAKLMAGRA